MAIILLSTTLLLPKVLKFTLIIYVVLYLSTILSSALQRSFVSLCYSPSSARHAVTILVITNFGVNLEAVEAWRLFLPSERFMTFLSAHIDVRYLLHTSRDVNSDPKNQIGVRNLEPSPKAHVVNVAQECRATKSSLLRCLPRVYQRSCYYKMNIIGC